MEHLPQIILLLAVAVGVVLLFQRLHVPTSLAYLLVGVMLGPHTIGPTVYVPEFDALAEFGVVFLLFTIGLSYSLPQLHALRHQVLGLGTGQVVLTTAFVGLAAWLVGVPAAAAFVVGAVFAQSSTTIIGSVLGERGEESSPHGRFGLAMSVFQDVTAVPFLVVIPVLGMAVSALALAGALGLAMVKAVLAFVLLFLAGRWLLRPLFHTVSGMRSSEMFTLAVLLVALLAAWTTSQLGLSLAFGAFLAGMMLGETEFRHQVESSIRPFRDVLLGLFFVGIGMRFDPASVPPIWVWAVTGALLMLVSKTVIVALLVRRSGIDPLVAWRTGLLLGVGGEFGLALIAISLDSGVIDSRMGQILITSVLLAMVGGALLIRFNGPLGRMIVRPPRAPEEGGAEPLPAIPEQYVVIGGYGRVGHTLAVLLQARGIPFIAFDSDSRRVAFGRREGHPVSYGNFGDPELLAAIRVDRAAMVLVTVDEGPTTLRIVSHLQRTCPHVPVIARARDIDSRAHLLEAGATHAYPETIEASLQLGGTALRMLGVPGDEVEGILRDVREGNYQPVLE
jgi:CPA2 family monovalent cation:H+ antiporter-2